jgi:hypothetical protein
LTGAIWAASAMTISACGLPQRPAAERLSLYQDATNRLP